jgi:hypothetical protein
MWASQPTMGTLRRKAIPGADLAVRGVEVLLPVRQYAAVTRLAVKRMITPVLPWWSPSARTGRPPAGDQFRSRGSGAIVPVPGSPDGMLEWRLAGLPVAA